MAPRPGTGPGDRLGATLALSAILFGVLILGVGFALDPPAPVAPTLDVILTETRSETPPEDADFIAQANNPGGGESDRPERPREEQLAPVPKIDPGVAPEPLVAQGVFILSVAMLVLMGASDMISVFIRSSLVQLNTPDRMRGRVSSISGLAISASNELGEMQSGLAAAFLGAAGAVVFGGAGAIVVTLVWAWYFPELRRANSFEPQALKREVST